MKIIDNQIPGPDSSTQIMKGTSNINTNGTYFMRLTLYKSDSFGEVLSLNTYWLSNNMDVNNWKKSTWYNTPCSSYADFEDLQMLPAIHLYTSIENELKDGVYKSTCGVTNPNDVSFVLL